MRKGFSLVEITVVLLIGGILALVFGTPFFTVPSNAAQEEALKMSARLAHAREQGILRGWSCLSFSARSVNYQDGDAFMSPMPGEGRTVSLNAELSLSPSVSGICFDALGRACSTGSNFDDGSRKYCKSGLKDVAMTFKTASDAVGLRLANFTGLAEPVKVTP